MTPFLSLVFAVSRETAIRIPTVCDLMSTQIEVSFHVNFLGALAMKGLTLT